MAEDEIEIHIDEPRDREKKEVVEDLDTKAKGKNTAVNKALQDIREDSGGERDILRDGTVLIEAEITDLQALPDEEQNQRAIKELQEIDGGLQMVRATPRGEGVKMDIRKAHLLTSYIMKNRDRWDASSGTDTAVAKANRRIYSEILDKLYDRLPLPDAAIGEAPEYRFGSIDRITEPMKKDIKDLTLDDALKSYKAIEDDVEAVDTDNPQWARQREIIEKARIFVVENDGAEGYRMPIGILNNDGTVKFRLREAGETSITPTTSDGKRQFIVDIDGSYVQEVQNSGRLRELAKAAVMGIEKLKAGQELTIKEDNGITEFLSLLKKEKATGQIDEDTHEFIMRFGVFLNLKLHDAGEITLQRSQLREYRQEYGQDGNEDADDDDDDLEEEDDEDDES